MGGLKGFGRDDGNEAPVFWEEGGEEKDNEY